MTKLARRDQESQRGGNLAAIGASIDAIGRAGEDEIRIAGMDEDGKRLDLAERVFPAASVGGTAKHAGKTTLFAGVITADAGEHIGQVHGTFLPE